MTPEQFCYWLQGRAELRPDTPPTADEWRMIREHLKTVFVKVTPQLGGPNVYRPGPGSGWEQDSQLKRMLARQTYC